MTHSAQRSFADSVRRWICSEASDRRESPKGKFETLRNLGRDMDGWCDINYTTDYLHLYKLEVFQAEGYCNVDQYEFQVGCPAIAYYEGRLWWASDFIADVVVSPAEIIVKGVKADLFTRRSWELLCGENLPQSQTPPTKVLFDYQERVDNSSEKWSATIADALLAELRSRWKSSFDRGGFSGATPVQAKTEKRIACQEEGISSRSFNAYVTEMAGKFEGPVHEKFGQVLTMVESDIPVYLTGPAGTGKNHLAEQVAQAVGLEFEYMGKVDDKFTDCVGYCDANGREHDTPLIRAARDGKLLFVDEIDASVPEVLVTVNALLANRYMVTGWGEFLRADDNFRIIVAGNTVGCGASWAYSGRFPLDAATLDRFALVEVGYDRRIEECLSRGNAEVLDYVRAFRTALRAIGDLRHPVSYRAIVSMAKLEEAGVNKPDVLASCLIKGLDADDVLLANKWIGNHVPGIESNGYYRACDRLAGRWRF